MEALIMPDVPNTLLEARQYIGYPVLRFDDEQVPQEGVVEDAVTNLLDEKWQPLPGVFIVIR